MDRPGGSTHGRSARGFALLLVIILLALALPVSAVGTEPATVTPYNISGTVVTDDASSTPIPDIKVKLYYDSTIVGGDPSYIYTYTDDAGEWGFADLDAGNYVVYFYDPNYKDGAYKNEYYDDKDDYATADRVAYDGGTNVTGVDAALTELRRAVEGTVKSEGGEGIKDMKVKLYKYTGGTTGDASVQCVGWSEVQGAYTDASGWYAFYGEEAGLYRVGAYDPRDNHYTKFYDEKPTLDDATDISYDGTATVSGIDLALELKTKEVWDKDRYTTAIDIAREAYPGWHGIDTIIIASGEDRASADPLAASGMCWAYDAPLFLVSKDGPPYAVKEAIAEIVDVNGPIDMIVVGGPKSVPDWVADKIESYVEGKFGGADVITGPGGTWRRVEGQDRYEVAYKIADEMATCGKWMPDDALIANGADASKFFDALALSPVARRRGAPVLLVSKDKVPSWTSAAIDKHGLNDLWVAGGDNSVGPKAKAKLGELGTVRAVWAGKDRYETARLVAEGALDQGWLSKDAVAVAAKLPDALTGGSVVGHRNGVLLLVETDKLPNPTGGYLENNKASIDECYIFGGPKSVSAKTRAAVEEKLK